MTVTVLLVDDHPVVRSGLRAVLDTDDVQVIGEAATGEEALALTAHLHPDVVLCDLRLGAGEMLLRLDPARPRPRPEKAVWVLSCNNNGNFGDRLGVRVSEFAPGEL